MAGRILLFGTLFLSAACGGGDTGSQPNSPLSTPMALVVNQDDTTVTTLRLDGKFSPMVGTLSLGPAQPDAIGGISFSLGEWIFVTNTKTNQVAAIDPIGGPSPILEDFLDSTGDPKLGQRPKRIYRDPFDREVLWTMNEGDPVSGVDTVGNCPVGGSATVLHNSHIAVGGDRPHIKKTSCLFGKGEQFASFSGPTAGNSAIPRYAFISSKTSGLISLVRNDPADGANQWSALIPLDLCDNGKETCDLSPFTPNGSAPAGMFWSQATGKIYAYLSGYGSVVEIAPDTLSIARRVDIATFPLNPDLSHAVAITPNGRSMLIIIEDRTDPDHVVTRFASIDLAQNPLALTPIAFPILADMRIAQFQFTPDGRQLYLLASNDTSGLSPAQAAHVSRDRLLVFDPSLVSLVEEVSLPPAETHAMDLWIVGAPGAGSAKGVVVTNATAGAIGTVSLIDAASRTIVATFPVGRNPKMVTVYYAGLAASDNQATPRW